MQQETGPPALGSAGHHDLIFAGAVVLGAVVVSLIVWFLIGMCGNLAGWG